MPHSCGTAYTGYLVKKKGLYYYKNNRIGSKENMSAKKMHELFEQLLGGYQIKEKKYIAPLKEMLLQVFIHLHQESINDMTILEKRVGKIEKNLETIEKRFVLTEIESELYLKYKKEFDTELLGIQGEIEKSNFNLSNLENAVENALNMALNLPSIWACGDLEEKRRIQKMVFPDGIRYDYQNNTYRTNRVNTSFSVIPHLQKDTAKKENGTSSNNLNLSRLVPWAGIEPALSKELDFESSASTNSATKAFRNFCFSTVADAKVCIFLN